MKKRSFFLSTGFFYRRYHSDTAGPDFSPLLLLPSSSFLYMNSKDEAYVDLASQLGTLNANTRTLVAQVTQITELNHKVGETARILHDLYVPQDC